MRSRIVQYQSGEGYDTLNLYMRDYHFDRHITLLITSKSDCDIPGPLPFLGILSPPYKSRVLGRKQAE